LLFKNSGVTKSIIFSNQTGKEPMVSNKPGSFRETGILDLDFLGICLSVIRVSFDTAIAKMKVKVFLPIRMRESYTFPRGF
jgi:hypothetical protein